ncbi:MAG: hypothetical protein JSV74_01295 [Dehalococcoidia bacterium]|nr:MAG: hypothetical protein JSV74_01295 [Dehalococcoidia bacterium]
MKIRYLDQLIILLICILVIIAFGVIGCNNTEKVQAVPKFEELSLPPIEVTIAQVFDEFEIDSIAAHDKYNGKRLCFYDIEVEEIDTRSTKRYFISGNGKFYLRSTSLMQNVEPGFVLNLVGFCQGFSDISRELIVINDCWVESVVGDLGTDEWVDPY